MRRSFGTMLLASTAICLLASAPAQAQTAEAEAADAAEPQADGETAGDIVVVGTRIEGARVTEALPVVVVGQDRLDAIGAVSGDELIRNIPQMGDVSFNPGNNAQTSNAARGDVGSVNLRSLGVGNTLVLLNGRRIVTHPASQGLSDTGTVPVLSYNSNAIPTTGLQRLEVLLDGAAALYGSDAVAGVVNTVLKDNYNGLRMQAQYGGAEGTHLREFQGNILAGKSFERGNITVSLEYTDRSALRAEDQDFTASANLRPLFADYPDFADSQTPDSRRPRNARRLAGAAGPGYRRPAASRGDESDNSGGRLYGSPDAPRGMLAGANRRPVSGEHRSRDQQCLPRSALRHRGRHHGDAQREALQRLRQRSL